MSRKHDSRNTSPQDQARLWDWLRQAPTVGGRPLHRRTLLRGLLGGAVVTIGLPPLERFMNGNGTAYAEAADEGFPKRFGLFFWGNGNLPERWTPTGDGKEWTLSDQLQPLATLKSKISVVSGTRLGVPNTVPHGAGAAGILSGRPIVSTGGNQTFGGPSIDQIIAEVLGTDTRFRSLEFGAKPGEGYSYNGPNSRNPPESSPYALFERLFGAGFVMPGETPKFDPTLGLRRSVLDGVSDQVTDLRKVVGYNDNQRLQAHFDGIRALEKRLAKLELAPPKLDACMVPEAPEADYPDIEGRPQLWAKNEAFAELSALALACDQTRVFSNWFTAPVNNHLFPGASSGSHELTHNEPGDQPEVHANTVRCVEALATQIAALDSVQEGSGTLLDHMLLLGCSEVSRGKTHSLEEMPIVLAGSCNGSMVTGTHYRSVAGENSSKVLLSICRAMGLSLATFGGEGGLVSDGLSAIEG
jgi:hypothetical protein